MVQYTPSRLLFGLPFSLCFPAISLVVGVWHNVEVQLLQPYTTIRKLHMVLDTGRTLVAVFDTTQRYSALP